MRRIFLFCVVFNLSYAQTRIEKTLINPNIKTVIINANQVFNVHLKTTQADIYNIEATISGQNYEQVVLQITVKDNTLEIHPKLQPLFHPKHDKLSIHKVIAVELNINIPINKTVYLNSDIATLSIEGQYKYLVAESQLGSCNLYNFKGNAIINTLKGNIKATVANTKVQADTRNGMLTLDYHKGNFYSISLKTIDGDIVVNSPTH